MTGLGSLFHAGVQVLNDNQCAWYDPSALIGYAPAQRPSCDHILRINANAIQAREKNKQQQGKKFPYYLKPVGTFGRLTHKVAPFN